MEGLEGLSKLIPEYKMLSANFVLSVSDRKSAQLLGFFAALCWGMRDWNPDLCALYDLGGAFAPAVCTQVHVQRLAAPFLLSNNCAQMLLGFSLEASFGTVRYLGIVTLSCLLANAAAMVTQPLDVVTGSSGFVCCLVGCQLVWVLHSKQVLTPALLCSYCVLLAVAISTCLWPHTSVLAGVAAFLSGALLSAVFFPMEFAQETKQVCIRTSAGLLWLSLALLVYIRASTLTFEGCSDMSYFDREGFRFPAGTDCVALCAEY